MSSILDKLVEGDARFVKEVDIIKRFQADSSSVSEEEIIGAISRITSLRNSQRLSLNVIKERGSNPAFVATVEPLIDAMTVLIRELNSAKEVVAANRPKIQRIIRLRQLIDTTTTSSASASTLGKALNDNRIARFNAELDFLEGRTTESDFERINEELLLEFNRMNEIGGEPRIDIQEKRLEAFFTKNGVQTQIRGNVKRINIKESLGFREIP